MELEQMELNNNNNNYSNKDYIEYLTIFMEILGFIIIITIIIGIFIYSCKKENYEILNIANNELIYQNKNTIETISINHLRITIDNTRKTPLLIKDNMGYKELLINEEDYNKYFIEK